MNKNHRILTAATLGLFCVSVLLLTGCKSTPPQSSLVEIYKEGMTPTRSYERIKLLYTVNWSSQEKAAMKYFIRKAEILDADALLILPHENEGLKVYPFGKIGVKYRYKALAVKWSDK